MFTFLLVLQAVIAALLVTLILIQRSEGGGLGVGGSSSGLMTARGQADFLTQATAFTAITFVGLSILLAGLATTRQSDSSIDTSLIEQSAPATESVNNDILSTIAGQAESSGAEEKEASAE